MFRVWEGDNKEYVIVRLALISPFGLIPKATLSHRILPLSSALKKKGHDIIVAVPPYTNPEASGSIENYDGVEIINIVLPDASPGFRHGFYSFSIGLRLAKVVRNFNPDAVYIFKPKAYSALAGMMLRLMNKRYPLYLDIDDLESDRDLEKRMGYTKWQKRFFRYQERWLLKRAEKVTVPSQYLEKFYGEKLGTEKVHYLPNGPVQKLGLAPIRNQLLDFECLPSFLRSLEVAGLSLLGKRVVLLYTRFTECALKDIVDFVRLFSQRYPAGILLVVGEGYESERLEVTAEIEKQGLSNFVSFTGWVDREKIKDYLSLAEVAIYPMSDTPFNRAKCSAKLIELMSMGKPVVASPVGEVLTYIKDGESGLLAKNTEEMVNKVIGLLEDNDKARQIGKAARRFLYENFNWDKLISNIDFLC